MDDNRESIETEITKDIFPISRKNLEFDTESCSKHVYEKLHGRAILWEGGKFPPIDKGIQKKITLFVNLIHRPVLFLFLAFGLYALFGKYLPFDVGFPFLVQNIPLPWSIIVGIGLWYLRDKLSIVYTTPKNFSRLEYMAEALGSKSYAHIPFGEGRDGEFETPAFQKKYANIIIALTIRRFVFSVFLLSMYILFVIYGSELISSYADIAVSKILEFLKL